MRNAENIKQVEALGVDMIGLDFNPKSPRYVNMINSGSGTIPDKADKDMVRNGDGNKKAKFAGVFTDDLPQNIITRVYNFKLDYVQLNGEETPEMIENLKATVVPDIKKDLKIIKTLKISCHEDFDKYSQYEGVADLFLFDMGYEAKETYNWSVLSTYKGSTPFLLSGEIGPEDAGRIKEFNHPMLYGIDINSRFETEPGIKDVAAISAFIKRIIKS